MRPLPRLREIERIGPARVERLGLGVRHLRNERLEILRRRRAPRLGVADHALRHAALLDARDLGQRLHDLQPRNAHAQFAGDELEEGETLIGRQLVDPALEARIALLLVERGQRKQAVAHPDVERDLLAPGALGQQERQHLGEIADAAIAFRAEPLRIARALDRKAPQKPRRDGLARLSAGEEIDHPRRAAP